MKRMRKVLITTLFFGGVILMVAPPLTLSQGERRNRNGVEYLKQIIEPSAREPTGETEEYEGTEEAEGTQKAKEKEATLPENILGYLTIEAIDAEYLIVEGTGRRDLAYYVGHLPETAMLGAMGNCVLAGHRGGKNGLFFKKLDQLKEGDLVKVVDLKGDSFVYKVSNSYITEPEDGAVKTQNLTESVLTLVTCAESGKRRLVIVCHGAD